MQDNSTGQNKRKIKNNNKSNYYKISSFKKKL